MATFCPRCGSFNAGQAAACLTCVGPLSGGPSTPDNTTCPNHSGASPLGRCGACGVTTCFDCGSLVDSRILCFTCANNAMTTTGSSAAGPTGGKKKGLGRKK